MTQTRVRTWEEIGARVASARAAAGLTQQDVADRLAIHRSAVARIEHGQRQLDALELAQLAEALGRSVAWFVAPPPPLVASHRKTASDHRSVAALEDELESAARDVELLLEIGELSSGDLPTIQVEDADGAIEAAAQARRTIDQAHGPLLGLSNVVEGLGLMAFSLDLGAEVIDGAYVRVGDLGVAVINGLADAGRRRFNVVHELGHHMLGDEYTTDVSLGQTREVRERLINVFAIHFLAPAPGMHSRWEELTTNSDDRAALIHIAAEYRLSWTAACSHACNVGLIDADRRAILEHRRPTAVDYVELGVSFGEELAPPALPQGFARACLRAYRNHKLGAARTIELLRGTVVSDELPTPQELPLDALRGDFA